MVYQIKNFHSNRMKCMSGYAGFNVIDILCLGGILAGGALRSLLRDVDSSEINDIDVFFYKEDMQTTAPIVEDYLVKEQGYSVIFRCPAGELVSLKNPEGSKIQLITKKGYTSVKELVESFDIVAGCAGVSLKEGLWIHTGFVRDTCKMKLSIQSVTYPIATLKRILKYSGYGYRISAEALERTIRDINAMDLTDDNMMFYVD